MAVDHLPGPAAVVLFGDVAGEPMTPSTTEHADRFGWWVCACVKGGNWRKGKPSTHIKMHAPTVKKCRTCGVTKAQSDAAGREANRSHR